MPNGGYRPWLPWLLTVWVFKDMKQRDAFSGLWIAITLLAGFFGALLYVLMRLGDMQAASPEKALTKTRAPAKKT